MTDCAPIRSALTTASRAAALAACFAALHGCAAPQPRRLSMEDARTMFASRGVQPGEPLPALPATTLEGAPTSVRALQGARPLVLVTASLTCSVARAQQADVDALREQFGERVAVVVLYTIEAHPKSDPCPYTGEEWIPKVNERDGVLERQPTTLEERLRLAREYQRRFSRGATVVVDTMDNAAWKAVGEAPNLGLVVDAAGVVRSREGWFDAKAATAALEALGVRPAASPSVPAGR
jgi:hypothetical protein